MNKLQRTASAIAITAVSLLGISACDADSASKATTPTKEATNQQETMPSKEGDPKEKWVTIDVDTSIQDQNGVHPFLEEKCFGGNLILRQHFMEWAGTSNYTWGYVTGLSDSVSPKDEACK